MQLVILPCYKGEFGDFRVYRRERKGATYIPLYVVLQISTNKFVEEFQRKASAFKWARTQPEGRETT